MDIENNKKKKKKIKVKANTSKTEINSDILILKNVVKKKPTKLILKRDFVLKNFKEVNNSKNLNITNPKILDFEQKSNSINKYALRLRGISKSFDGRPVLKDINIDVPAGSIVGLMGPNGAGKSTAFSICTGSIKPNSGYVEFFGENINELPIHKRALKGLSLVQQSKGLFSGMSVYDNLYGILELHIKERDKIDAKINQLLNYFGLVYTKNLLAENLSGGEGRKITMLQRLCVKNVRLLLLDEPCSALDPLSVESLKKFILELKKAGVTILICEHQVQSVIDILDYCTVIKDGHILASGKPKDVIKDERAKKYYFGSSLTI